MAVITGKRAAKEGLKVAEMEEEILDFSEDSPVEVSNFKSVNAEEYKREEYPAKIVKAEDSNLMFAWVDSLKSEDWKTISCYVYRQWPIIDRKKTDPKKPNYIDVLGAHFTLDDLLGSHGGGQYKLIFSDSSKMVAGRGGQIGIAYLNCRGSNYPEPLLVFEELDMFARENQAFVDKLKAEGKIGSDGKVMTNQPVQGGTGATNDPQVMQLLNTLVSKVLAQQNQPASKEEGMQSQMFMKTYDTTVEMLKTQMKGDDPEKWVKLLTLVIPLFNKPDNSNSMLETIMKLQNDAQARENNLMMKMMEIVQAKREDDGGLDKQLDTFLKLKEVMGNGEGGNGRNPKWWEVAIEHGAPVLGKAFDMLTGVISVKNYDKGLKMQQGNPAPVVQQVPQVEGGKVVEMPSQEEKPVSQFGMLLRQYGGMILNAINKEQSGDDFADALVGMVGRPMYVQIAMVGKEQLLAEMKAVPEFWEKVAPIEPMVVQFVDEFIAYGKEEGEKE